MWLCMILCHLITHFWGRDSLTIWPLDRDKRQVHDVLWHDKDLKRLISLLDLFLSWCEPWRIIEEFGVINVLVFLCPHRPWPLPPQSAQWITAGCGQSFSDRERQDWISQIRFIDSALYFLRFFSQHKLCLNPSLLAQQQSASGVISAMVVLQYWYSISQSCIWVSRVQSQMKDITVVICDVTCLFLSADIWHALGHSCFQLGFSSL